MNGREAELAGDGRRLALVYALTVLVLLPVLIGLGLLMRLRQAAWIQVSPGFFYAVMTLHGLGMSGLLYTASFAGVWHVLQRHLRLPPGVLGAVWVATVLGVVGLVVATLLGGFATGWYLLYPLPFVNATWPAWSTGLAILSLLVLGVAWLLGLLSLIHGMAARYGLGNLLGWQYLRGAAPAVELPPIVLITTASALPGVVAFLAGAAVFMLYGIQWFEPSLSFDALFWKNVVFLFGHTLVNITLYLGVAWVYELLPGYTGRPWKTNRVVALSWNTTLVLVLLAFFHHLYMDFAQPKALQVTGQLASYASAVPATVVTMFGAIAQLYRSGMRWSIVPLCFLLGFVGWLIGGFAAVVDSTIAMNTVLHNTLWVPAHFHTYFLLGFVLFLLGWLFHLFRVEAGAWGERLARGGLGLFVLGGAGFLLAFYLGGVHGVPRRYAGYEAIPLAAVREAGESLAGGAAWGVGVLLLGLALIYVVLLAHLRRAWSRSA